MSFFSVNIIFLDQWYPGNYKITTKFRFFFVFFSFFFFFGGGGGVHGPATSPWTTRATSWVQDRFIRNQALRNRSQTANQIVADLHQATRVRVTGQTFRNRLRAADLHARRHRVVPTLTNRNIAHRREWYREGQNWGICRWSRVMFSDESLFTLDFLDRRCRVWRRRNERHANVTMRFHYRFDGGSVMVCGDMVSILCKEVSLSSTTGTTYWHPLTYCVHIVQGRVTEQYYWDNILTPFDVLCPYCARKGHWAVLLGQHTDTLWRTVSILCKEGSLISTTGTTYGHPLTICVHIVQGRVTEQYYWDNILTPFDVLCPYCARKRHWAVLLGQHTDTLWRSVSILCKEGSLRSTTGTTYWHPLTYCVHIVRGRVTEQYYWDNILTPFDVLCPYCARKGHWAVLLGQHTDTLWRIVSILCKEGSLRSTTGTTYWHPLTYCVHIVQGSVTEEYYWDNILTPFDVLCPYCARKGHWAVLLGQHTDTLWRTVSILCKEVSLRSTTGTTYWHPLTYCVHIVQGRVTEEYYWDNILTPFDVLCPYCARKGHWGVLLGQHTDTLWRTVSILCKEGSLRSTTGTTYWHPLTYCVHIVQGSVTEEYYWDNLLTPFDVLCPYCARKCHWQYYWDNLLTPFDVLCPYCTRKCHWQYYWDNLLTPFDVLCPYCARKGHWAVLLGQPTDTLWRTVSILCKEVSLSSTTGTTYWHPLTYCVHIVQGRVTEEYYWDNILTPFDVLCPYCARKCHWGVLLGQPTDTLWRTVSILCKEVSLAVLLGQPTDTLWRTVSILYKEVSLAVLLGQPTDTLWRTVSILCKEGSLSSTTGTTYWHPLTYCVHIVQGSVTEQYYWDNILTPFDVLCPYCARKGHWGVLLGQPTDTLWRIGSILCKEGSLSSTTGTTYGHPLTYCVHIVQGSVTEEYYWDNILTPFDVLCPYCARKCHWGVLLGQPTDTLWRTVSILCKEVSLRSTTGTTYWHPLTYCVHIVQGRVTEEYYWDNILTPFDVLCPYCARKCHWAVLLGQHTDTLWRTVSILCKEGSLSSTTGTTYGHPLTYCVHIVLGSVTEEYYWDNILTPFGVLCPYCARKCHWGVLLGQHTDTLWRTVSILCKEVSLRSTTGTTYWHPLTYCVHIVQGSVTEQYYWDNILTPFDVLCPYCARKGHWGVLLGQHTDTLWLTVSILCKEVSLRSTTGTTYWHPLTYCVHIVQGRVTEEYYWVNIRTPFDLLCPYCARKCHWGVLLGQHTDTLWRTVSILCKEVSLRSTTGTTYWHPLTYCVHIVQGSVTGSTTGTTYWHPLTYCVHIVQGRVTGSTTGTTYWHPLTYCVHIVQGSVTEEYYWDNLLTPFDVLCPYCARKCHWQYYWDNLLTPFDVLCPYCARKCHWQYYWDNILTPFDVLCPYCARKGHWAVLLGQHTDTLWRTVSILCKEVSLRSTTGTTYWHPLTYWVHIVQGSVTEQYYWDNILTPFDVLCPYCARKGHWGVLLGQHTDTLWRIVSILCKEGSLSSTTGTTYWHPLTYCVHIVQGRVT